METLSSVSDCTEVFDRLFRVCGEFDSALTKSGEAIFASICGGNLIRHNQHEALRAVDSFVHISNFYKKELDMKDYAAVGHVRTSVRIVRDQLAGRRCFGCCAGLRTLVTRQLKELESELKSVDFRYDTLVVAGYHADNREHLERLYSLACEYIQEALEALDKVGELHLKELGF